MDLNNYDINYDRAVTSWDEALPFGNGRMGCLLYGDGPIRFALDRVDLWDTRPHPATLEDGFCYENLVKLSLSKKEADWNERERLFENVYNELPYPSKITAGRLELDFGKKLEQVHSYLDIKKAVGRMSFSEGSVEVFLHATRAAGVARVSGSYQLKLHIPNYISEGEYKDFPISGEGGAISPLKGMGYPKAEIIRENGFTFYRQETRTDFFYGIFVYSVKRADSTELYFTVATSNDAKDYERAAKQQLKATAEVGYERLKREHIAWWETYWKQSEISIGDPLLEKTYYRSWYLFASCSRKGSYPMPLQGVWTADNDCLPPWRGDYHHDTNTQLSYQSYLKANRLREGEAFLDYLWQLKPQFERMAREFYHVDGLLIPGVSTIDGKPMGGWSQYALSPTMSIWTAQSFDEYYLYTGDEAFLRERAFPFLEGIGKAIKGLLKEENGRLYLPLSTSPEIHDAAPEAYLEPNSNFDLALMRYLYARLIDYCGILHKDAGEYVSLLSGLDDIATIDGFIGLNRTERLQESHRHFSHLMCLYPLHLINYDTEEHKKLYRNVIREIERLGMGFWVGFSYAMCAQIYAMAEMGNAAYEKLRQFADGFVAENGFHLNGDFQNKGYSTLHYRPFTLESLFGYCDALQEMLLQEHQGYLHLFPAIPGTWEGRDVSFRQLRSYGGVLVSARAKDGYLQEVLLELPKPMHVKLKNTFRGKSAVLKCAGRNEIIFEKDGFFKISLPKGSVEIAAEQTVAKQQATELVTVENVTAEQSVRKDERL